MKFIAIRTIERVQKCGCGGYEFFGKNLKGEDVCIHFLELDSSKIKLDSSSAIVQALDNAIRDLERMLTK